MPHETYPVPDLFSRGFYLENYRKALEKSLSWSKT